jgi:GTPase involved in cell partitioning and DNA repair
MKGKQDGKHGGDIKLSVPIGTLVYEIINMD